MITTRDATLAAGAVKNGTRTAQLSRDAQAFGVPSSVTQATRQMTVYNIRVVGPRDACWPACCAGLTITDHGDGCATLRGPLADVATLRRVLLALSGCGLAVLTMHRTQP